jgi:hypothetical protein
VFLTERGIFNGTHENHTEHTMYWKDKMYGLLVLTTEYKKTAEKESYKTHRAINNSLWLLIWMLINIMKLTLPTYCIQPAINHVNPYNLHYAPTHSFHYIDYAPLHSICKFKITWFRQYLLTNISWKSPNIKPSSKDEKQAASGICFLFSTER